MTNRYGNKFNEMIIPKYKNGEKVTMLSIDYGISTAVIYQWNQKISNT